MESSSIVPVTDYKEIYDQQFFKDRDASTRYAAETILDIVTGLLPNVTAAADVGCGVEPGYLS